MKNGKSAVILKEFWQDSRHFADVFNGYFFDGEEVIQAEDLQELDTDVSACFKVKDYKQTLERTRDVIKKTAKVPELLEEKDYIHNVIAKIPQ